MILNPGNWMGKGSYRAIGETVGTNFTADISLSEDEQGQLIESRIEIDGGASLDLIVWVIPDEFGTYSVNVRGAGFEVEGTAKLESVPHLGLLWSEDDSMHVAFALFSMPDSLGLRGFWRNERDTITWELALRPQQQVISGGNVVSIDVRRRH
jgi:hypothetical protein